MREFYNKHKKALYGTIIVHMVVVVLMLSFKIKSNYDEFYSEVQIEFQTMEFEEIVREESKDKLKELLKETELTPEEKIMQDIRERSNKAVNEALEDLEQELSDDKQMEDDDLYQEAKDLQDRLDETNKRFKENREFGAEDTDVKNIKKDKKPVNRAKGTTNISYKLPGGRQMIKKSVPVYMCEGGGKVVVKIEVNNAGYVTYATIDQNNSVNDPCLHPTAVRAAKTTRFNADASAPKIVKGTITYIFVSQ